MSPAPRIIIKKQRDPSPEAKRLALAEGEDEVVWLQPLAALGVLPEQIEPWLDQ